MIQFDCCECGRNVIAIIPEKLPEPPLCGNCLYAPGWHEDYELRRMLGGAESGAPWPFA